MTPFKRLPIKYIAAGLLTALSLPNFGQEAQSCPPHILYLAHTGNIEGAISCYQSFVETSGTHDTDFIEQLGLKILELGSRSEQAEACAMALYGAGIAMNEKAIPILARAISSQDPKLQLIALNFLSRWQNEELDRHLAQALRSNYLLIRLQAASQIALQKHKNACLHLESLMAKLNTELWVLFPQLFAAVGDAESTKMLRKLLNHQREDVRLETILSIIKAKRDDFLPKLRSLATHGTAKELEGCAKAFAAFHDDTSIPQLSKLIASPVKSVAITAMQALYQLDKTTVTEPLKFLAMQGDLFAINTLASIAGTDQTLEYLVASQDIHIRINAGLALLEKSNPRCLSVLKEILIHDNRDLAFSKVLSPGKALHCWKAIPSASHNFKESPEDLELSLSFREDVLAKAIDLDEDSFLCLIESIFERRQNDLVPTATALLEQLQSTKAINLLKKYHQCAGAPLIRNYCNLALCHIGEEGPYAEMLYQWIKAEAALSFIQLRPILPWSQGDSLVLDTITAEEKSRLLLEGFQVFAEKQDVSSINLLLEAIKSGNAQNKYALAGLLIRASM